jgi:hypothetical protein
MLAIHSPTSRAYCRIVMHRPAPAGGGNLFFVVQKDEPYGGGQVRATRGPMIGIAPTHRGVSVRCSAADCPRTGGAADAVRREPDDIKAVYRSAGILKDGRVVFPICGNTYRLVVLRRAPPQPIHLPVDVGCLTPGGRGWGLSSGFFPLILPAPAPLVALPTVAGPTCLPVAQCFPEAHTCSAIAA